MLRFKEVELHNYLSFKDAKLDLENQGLTLIAGKNHSNNAYTSNSSGKTSVLSGITYGLYGRTVEGNSGDSVINREVGKDCHVFLTMERDGTTYRIERYRKGSHGNGNKVRLFANGDEVTTSRASLTNAKIEGILGIDFSTYVNTVSYGQGDVPIFSQATDKGKKEILENLANISIYEKAQSLAKDRLNDVINEITQSKLKISELNSKVNMLNSYANQAKEKNDSIVKQKKIDEHSIIMLNDSLKKNTITLDRATKAHKELEEAVNSYKRDNPLPSTSELTSIAQKLYQEVTQYQQASSQAKSTLQEAVAQLKNTADAKTCPVCGQPLDAEHRAKEVSRLKSTINDYLSIYKQNSESYSQIYPKYQQAKDRVQEVDSKVNNIYKELQELQSKEHKALQYVNQVKYSVEHDKAQLEALKSKTYDLATPDYSSDIASAKASIETLNSKLDDLYHKQEDYDIIVNKVFSRTGVSSMALDLIVPFLNERTNYYLAKLSGSIIQVNMSTQTLNANNTLADKFDIQVENESGANSYQLCSTGEKKRIDIAISFAIQDMQNSRSDMATNIAIYDECFDGLDAVGAETVIDLLKEKAKELSSIFVITHNDTLKPFFDSVITVEKGKDGISKIVGDNGEN